jgi:hypothetical protein
LRKLCKFEKKAGSGFPREERLAGAGNGWENPRSGLFANKTVSRIHGRFLLAREMKR